MKREFVATQSGLIPVCFGCVVSVWCRPYLVKVQFCHVLLEEVDWDGVALDAVPPGQFGGGSMTVVLLRAAAARIVGLMVLTVAPKRKDRNRQTSVLSHRGNNGLPKSFPGHEKRVHYFSYMKRGKLNVYWSFRKA